MGDEQAEGRGGQALHGDGVTPAEAYAAAIGADPAEVARVRTQVRAMAVRNGFSERAADLVLALDEILANAQEHGAPPIEVWVWVDGRLVVEVTDEGPGFDRAQVWSTHPPEPFGQRGRGLWIARQLADTVQILTGERGTRVRIELSPDPHIGA